MTDKPLHWGIMGTGGIAAAFAQDLELTGSGVAAAVGSRSAGSAERFADARNIPWVVLPLEQGELEGVDLLLNFYPS